LLDRLATGGMAEVFLARAKNNDRLVALKRVLPHVASNDEFIAMLIDEAKIVGHLSHPNIAKILDIGQHQGTYFLALEYVSGQDLRSLWDRHRDGEAPEKMSIPLAVRIVQQVALALEHAHNAKDSKGNPLGIIHRDVSPQNILIGYDGAVKIIDFGIAKASNRAVRTQTGMLKGKYAYMAPEQARGDVIDHRADVFALAIVLYELLASDRAFRADGDFALLEKVRRAELTPLHQFRPDVPAALERVLMQALTREPGDRTSTALAFGQQLLAVVPEIVPQQTVGALVRRLFRDEHLAEQRRLDQVHLTGSQTAVHKALVSTSVSRGNRRRTGEGPADTSAADDTSVEPRPLELPRAERKPQQGLLADVSEFSVAQHDTRLDASIEEASRLEVSVARAVDTLPPMLSPTLLPSQPSRFPVAWVLAAAAAGLAVGAIVAVAATRRAEVLPVDTLIVAEPREVRVFRGGEQLCARTPCGVALGEGHHELMLRHASGVAVAQSVDIRAKDAALIDVAIAANVAINIDSEPSGAQVLRRDVSGAAVVIGMTPMELPREKVGTDVELTLLKDGHEPTTLVRRVAAANNWKVALWSSTTAVDIKTVPADAMVQVQDKDRQAPVSVQAGRRPVVVVVSRPGCTPERLSLVGNGRARAEKSVTLSCRPFEGMLSIPARPAFVAIDGMSVPRALDLDAYPLPVGDWTLTTRGTRGKPTSHIVTVRAGQTTFFSFEEGR
jgi:serine/threonine protein kinase